MSDIEKEPTPAIMSSEGQTAVSAVTPEVQNAGSVPAASDDIPAADADVKEESQKVIEQPVNAEKKAEVPKDPKEDPVGWVSSLFPAAVHKVNYKVLDWAQQLAIEEEGKRQPLPGKNDAVTKNQFLGFLRDGALLAKLANRFKPGAVETVHEGEALKDKGNQTSNISAFLTFAKESAGLTDDQLFTVADLQDKGKAGYQAVFNTVMQLGNKAQEKFEQKGIDTDQLVQVASQAVRTNLIQTILNFFRRARPAQSPKLLAKEAEEKEKAEKATAVEKVVEDKPAAVEVEEECKKVEVSAAVAAN